jgi:predicted dehydrogenase
VSVAPRRVAIVGAGIGAAHMDGYLELPPGMFEVAVVCDLQEDRAGALAARAPGCATSASLGEVLARPDVDVVDVCLPPVLHRSAILEALAAGKHVVCEKPLVASPASPRSIRCRSRASPLPNRYW